MSIENTTFVSAAMTEEAAVLFPAIKVPSPEPKTRQPEYLGRNPFTEMRRRQDHAQFLLEAERTSAKKAQAATEAHERRKQQMQLEYTHPKALQLSAAEQAALVENSATQLFPQGRGTGSVVLPPIPVSPISPVLSPAVRSGSSSPSFAVCEEALWDEAQFIDQGEPLVTRAESKTSKSQLVKHKKQKHLGYFGEAVENIFTFDVAPLLRLPLESDRVTIFVNTPFTLSRLVLIDDGPLRAIFGSSELRIPRVNGEMLRADKKLLEGTEPHEQLKNLHVTLSGKPPAPWAGESVSVTMHLSRFSHTVKSFTIRTSAKKFSNIFSRFGVDLSSLARVAPFPLRLDPDQQTQRTDAESIEAHFCAKTQLRVLSCSFRMKLFTGCVTAKAQLVASGVLGVAEPESELSLRLPLPIAGFSFRSASRMLSFLDVFSFSDFAMKLRRESGNEYMLVELLWNIADSPLLGFVRSMYNDEPTIKLSGIVDSKSTRITLRAEDLVQNRTTTLWRFLKLRKIVAFVECELGVTRFGVECIAGVPCGEDVIDFEGRIFSELSETSLTSIATPQEQHKQDGTSMKFSGSPLEVVWTGCGGQSFAVMKDLSLQLNISCDTVLPARCEILGRLLLCTGEAGSGDCSLEVPATAFFTLDSLPDYVVIADLTSTGGTGLSDIISVFVDCSSVATADIAENNAKCLALGQLLHLDKAVVALNATTGKSVTTSQKFVCPPGVNILIEQAIVHFKATGFERPSAHQHHCSGRLQVSMEKGSPACQILGALSVETPVVFGSATCISRSSPFAGPEVEVTLRLNQVASQDYNALHVKGKMMLNGSPLTLHRMSFSPSLLPGCFQLSVLTTYAAVPDGVLQGPAAGLCPSRTFFADKYFDLRMMWRNNGSGLIEIVEDNAAAKECGMRDAVHAVLLILVGEHLDASRQRIRALEEELSDIRRKQTELQAAIEASRNVTEPTKTDCVAITIASRIFLDQYRRLLSRVTPQQGSHSATKPTDRLHDRLQRACISTSLFRHIRALDSVVKTCGNAFARSLSFNQIHGFSSAFEFCCCASVRELQIVELERQSVVLSLRRHITMLERCMVGFISMYSIDGVRLEGTASLEQKSHASISLNVHGTIRGKHFSSVFPLYRASLSQSEVSNAVLYHSREILRLILVSADTEM